MGAGVTRIILILATAWPSQATFKFIPDEFVCPTNPILYSVAAGDGTGNFLKKILLVQGIRPANPPLYSVATGDGTSNFLKKILWVQGIRPANPILYSVAAGDGTGNFLKKNLMGAGY